VLVKGGGCYYLGLGLRLEAHDADERGSGVHEMLAEDEFAEILFRGQQDRVGLPAAVENCFIVNA